MVFVIKMTVTRWLNKSLCMDGSNLRSQFRLHSLGRDIFNLSLVENNLNRDVPDSLTRDVQNSSVAESIIAKRRSKDSFSEADLQQADSAEKKHSIDNDNQFSNSNNVEYLVWTN